MSNQSNSFDGANVFGGFNVQGNQFSGPVNIGGSCRDDTDGLQCLRLLKTVNPEDERRRILTVKDQLVTASYSWILEDENFRSWLNEDTNHLLWIKGGPGKGKTMMMAGLVEALPEARISEGAVALSYFFCQNSESELRKVTSIVKGLIYMLAFRERSLIHHLRKKYEAGGEEIFTGPRALFTLWHVLEDMLKDFHGTRVYLIVDGLDECDDPEFDDFLCLLSGYNSTTPGKIKWLVTSRPLPRIEDIIGPDQDRYRISLEIEAQHVSQGVETFISEKVNLLRLKKNWSEGTTQTVHSYLRRNAEGTFLWVALVCQRLRRFPSWKVEDELTKLASLQRGLDSFYERMMQVVRDEIPEYADLCMNILRTMTLAYRPLRLRELGTVVALPHDLQNDSPNFGALRDLIERCGSFILVHDDTIYFVHQSAKDYLSAGSGHRDFSFNLLQEHSSIAEKCLDTLNSCLQDHQFPHPTLLSKQELGDAGLRLLSRIAYACSYWIHHTLEYVSQTSFEDSIPNQGKICDLLNSRLIAWVHALGSLKELTACVRIIKALLSTQGFESTSLFHVIHDTYRFLRQNRHIIEKSPNQAYTSALLFAPKSSRIRENYQNRIPEWIRLRTRLNNTWDACLETLPGHSDEILSLTFSFDGSLLASKAVDGVRLWETETGKCRGMFSSGLYSWLLAFSPDDRLLALVSKDNFELLDTATGCQKISRASHIVSCLFAPDSQIIACSDDRSVRLWNISTGENCGIFEHQGERFGNMAFSHDSKLIVIAFQSRIEVRDLKTSNIVATSQEYCYEVNSVQFSPDSRFVLFASFASIWIWIQPTERPAKKLEGHIGGVRSAKISPDGRFIVSTHGTESPLILWESATGNKLRTFNVPLPRLSEPMFSPDSSLMVTPLPKGAKSWDTETGEEIATFEASEETNGEFSERSVCSKDGKLFAQDMGCETRVWEVATGALLDTLEGHSGFISALQFSPAGGLIASASHDATVKLWSLNNGTSNQAIFRKETAAINIVAISLDGSLAASISCNGDICLWDVESGSSRTLLSPDMSYADAADLVISPDNSLLAASTASDVWIWETENGSLRYENPSYDDIRLIDRIVFSPDSRLLKIKYYESGIDLVENQTGIFEDIREPSHAKSTGSQKSPDGRFFAGLDSTLLSSCLWEQQKDTEPAIFRCELGGAGGVATFSPDSKFIAFVSIESFISVWETETGACHDVSSNFICCTSVGSFSHDNRFIIYTCGHEYILRLLELSTGISLPLAFVCGDPVKLVTFSPDASNVAAVSGSTIVLWETTSGSLAGKLEYDQKPVSDITFLPNRNTLIAGHEDGTIRSWDTNNHVLLHTLNTKDCPARFSLDSKRNFLWIGDEGFFFDQFLQPCEKSAISLEDSDDWVLFNEERVFWLPTEFRPTETWTWDASSKYLVVGHRSGDLTFVHFDT